MKLNLFLAKNMLYKTHIATSLCIAVPILAITKDISATSVGCITIGALLPDLDSPKSYLGRRLPFISSPLNKMFGHRGFMHTLSMIFLLAIISVLLFLFFGKFFPILITLGYLLHLIEDGFSVSGEKWLYPLKDKNYIIPYKLFKYKTGDIKEYCILIIAVCILLFEIIYFYNHGFIQMHNLMLNNHLNYFIHSKNYKEYKYF